MLEFLPGEEAQVDYGQGALTLCRGPGKYKRPCLFVMTLKYSGKSFRKIVWKTDQETWARLHEEAFHAFGGCPQYVVLDNLKEGVLRPDLYEPELNPGVRGAARALRRRRRSVPRARSESQGHGRERDPAHAGHALKGKRFESIDAQNAWLAHWEERWAAPRIHGRKKRQVLEMYREERPHLRPLPAERFRFFTQDTRTVDDGGSSRSARRTTPRCRRRRTAKSRCASTSARSRSSIAAGNVRAPAREGAAPRAAFSSTRVIGSSIRRARPRGS